MLTIIFGLSLILLSLAFFVAGKSYEKKNKVLKDGTETIYELPWYMASLILICIGMLLIIW